MANAKNKILENFLDENEQFKGKFIGFKYNRGGMGVSRIDNDWFECDNYYISIEDLIKALRESLSHPVQLPALSEEQAKDEVAKEYKDENGKPFNSWDSLLGHFTGIIPKAIAPELKKAITEAILLYASQSPKSKTMDAKDKRIKELEEASMKLFDMVHESDLIHNKIKANELYHIIEPKQGNKLKQDGAERL